MQVSTKRPGSAWIAASVAKPCVAVVFSSLFAVGAAKADGAFFQFDVSPETTNAVFVFVREPLSFGLNHVRYEDGRRTTLNLLYRLPLPDSAPTIRIGPSLGVVDATGLASRTDFGAKISIDKWMPTDFGSIYLLGEYNSIENAAFVSAQFGFSGPGLQFEASYGESDSYSETSLAVSKKLGRGPVSLRAGYRLSAEEVFVGLSVNTF